MKFLIVLLFAVLAVASAHRYFHPVLLPFRHRGGDDEYAASLGGADVGAYRREQTVRRGPFGETRDTDISGLSLGGAKVGLYSRERDGAVPLYG